jgi:hypothetical protein
MRSLPLLLLLTLPLSAAPEWKAPAEIPYGELSVLELVEADPAQPALPRPGDEKLGPLELRSAEATANGRGWKLTVQPLVPGLAVIPSQDLGDGRRAPELRIRVPRTVPFGAPWQGHGGGQGDILPYIPFPWAWASLLLLPFAALGVWIFRRWRNNAPKRALHHARRAFAHHWPPTSREREVLDAAHQAGCELLAAHFGEEARSWGFQEFHSLHLDVWGTWIQSLDAARFSRKDPPFPPLNQLLKALGDAK